MDYRLEKQKLDQCINILNSVNLGNATVWLATWDLVKTFMDDPDYDVLVSENEAWDLLVRDAEKESFTFEYGAEDHYDHVQSWMFTAGLIKDGLEEE